MPTSFRLRCEAVAYRQGFIEVQPQIHSGFVNIELWQVDPESNPEAVWVCDELLFDDMVIGNVELELTPFQARLLAEALIAAASQVEADSPNST